MTDKEKENVRALRCTSTPGDHTSNCEQCPYWKKEQLNGRLKEKLGTDTWTSCDIDKVGLDAADLIERLTAENVVLPDGQASAIESLRKEIEWKDMVIALAQRKQAEAEAERDAAIADLKISSGCASCKYHCSDPIFCRDCNKKQNCKCMSCSLGLTNWKWSGLPETPEKGEKA